MEDSGKKSYRLPSKKTLEHATKLAITQDKPIMLDYWTSSLDKEAFVGVRPNEEKLLAKSEDEYTSPVANMFRCENEYIIVTENSIYLTTSDIEVKHIG